MNPSPNLFLVGPMGAGKTSIGRRLARQFALPFVDLDEAIETRTGASIALVFELEGEQGFRQREAAALRQCSASAGIVLAGGGGIVLRADNRAWLAAHGFVVYLEVGVERQLQRLRRDRKRPLLASADREQRLHAMGREREPLYREIADLCITPRDESLHAASKRVAGLIDEAWQRAPMGAAP